MRRVLISASFGLLIIHPVRAQEPTPAADTGYKKSVGFGVTINPVLLLIDESVGFFPLGISNFLIPIRISPRVIIEPEFGMFRTTSEEGGGESKFSNTRLGVGLLLGFPERGGLHPYIGPRFGWSRTSSESSFGGGTFTTKMSGWNFGGVLGAHHFFSPHFSLGGEIQLMRSSSSIEDDSGGVPSDQSQSAVTTGGTAILRWFF